MEGRFDFTYDPAVYDPATYNGSQADVLALQKHMAEVMKMSLAALVGSGVQPNDINVQYLSETPTSPQGTCVFHFLCPLTTSPLILAHSMNQITGATLKSELEALATSSNIDPAPFQFQPADVVASYAVMSTSTPAATTYSAATSSQSADPRREGPVPLPSSCNSSLTAPLSLKPRPNNPWILTKLILGCVSL